MAIHEGTDLHKRVERYEAAINELRSCHQDIKDVLAEHVLYERWQQIGAELGFTPRETQSPQPSQAPTLHPMSELSDAWG